MESNVDNSVTSIIVFGASGRMGTRIVALAFGDAAFEIRAALTRDGSTRVGSSIAGGGDAHANVVMLKTAKNIEKTAVFADVVIDFSSDAGAMESLAMAERAGAALLIGTTALSDATMSALRKASSSRAIMVAPNTSLGVALLSVLVRDSFRALGSDYHVSIVEAHHAAKKDAPSGTALRLAKAAREAGCELRDDQILAMRGGDVVGEHTVRFAGPGEYIELTHRATTRDLFARGALRCAAWLKGKPAGWYSVQDVVGLPG
jgi:4-hydroxy-tetrahydrodipicolinate reductase